MDVNQELIELQKQLIVKNNELDAIKNKLGVRFDLPKSESDIKLKETWFVIHSQIMDLIKKSKC